MQSKTNVANIVSSKSIAKSDSNKSVAKPVVKSVDKLIMKSDVNPVVKSIAKPDVNPVVKSVAKPVVNTVTKSIAKPVINTVAKSIAKPVVNTVAKSDAKPVVNTVAKSITKPVSKSIVKPISKSVAKPVNKSITKPASKIVAKSVTKPIAKIVELSSDSSTEESIDVCSNEEQTLDCSSLSDVDVDDNNQSVDDDVSEEANENDQSTNDDDSEINDNNQSDNDDVFEVNENDQSDNDEANSGEPELISNDANDIRNIRFEEIGNDGKFSWGRYSDFKVVIMNKNGYINTSSLIKCHNKRNKKKLFTGWSNGKNNKAFLEELSKEIKIPVKELLISVKNGNYHQTFTWGTYAHPDIIPHFASWLSPVFAIKVSKIVNEFFIKKVIDENKAKLKENDQQNVPPSDIIKKNNDNVIKNIPSSSAILSNSIAQKGVLQSNAPTRRNIIVKNNDSLKKKSQHDRKYVSPLNDVTAQKGTTTVKNMQFGPIDDKYNWGSYGDIKFAIMNVNGYINTSNLTDKYNKENDTTKSYSGWANGKNNKKFLDVLSNDLGISVPNLRVVVKPKSMCATYLIGIYVHPKIIPYFASWVSVECAVEISNIVYDCFTKKKKDEKDIQITFLLKKNESLMNSNKNMMKTIKNVSDKVSNSCKQYDAIIERNSDLFDEQITKQSNNALLKKNKLLMKSNQNMMKTIKNVNDELIESCKQFDDLFEERNDDSLDQK